MPLHGRGLCGTDYNTLRDKGVLNRKYPVGTEPIHVDKVNEFLAGYKVLARDVDEAAFVCGEQPCPEAPHPADLKKASISVTPRDIWLESRAEDLARAIHEYSRNGGFRDEQTLKLIYGWSNEFQEILDDITTLMTGPRIHA